MGAFTGAGTSAARSFGAVRLGLKFFEELPSVDATGAPVIGAPTPLDLEAVSGVGRLVALAELALAECAAGDDDAGAALLLCLPKPAGETLVPAGVLGLLAEDGPIRFDPRSSRTFAGSRDAIFAALTEADRLLSTRVVRTVYLGGVESLVDRESLDRHLRAGRIKTATTEGFVPGEGAAFLRLELGVSHDAIGLLAGIGHATESFPRGSAQPNTGEGLAKAAREALAAAQTPVSSVGAFVHDASGDRFGFREAAMALVRLRARAEPTPQTLTPASCTGELGAAYGPFALGLAATWLRRDVVPGPAALVLGTQAGPGRCAAAVLAAPASAHAPRRR